MRVVFEVPSHREENVNYIHEVSTSCKSPDIGWAIATNGSMLSSNFDYVDRNIIMKYKEVQVRDPLISMAEARSYAHDLATLYFSPDYRILADHNFVYKPGWEDYILEACDDLDRFTKMTFRKCFMGMGGMLGSYGHGRRAFLGVQPIFSTSKGIMYDRPGVYDKMLKLPGSLDEQYLCTVLFMEGYVPLKKMLSPIIHNRIHDGEKLHDPTFMEDNFTTLVVRELWNDHNWVLQPKTTTKELTLTGGKYYGHVPRTGLKAMAKLKNELWQIPGIYEEFIKTNYEKEEVKLTGKDLFA
jgi:hypothetical protein